MSDHLATGQFIATVERKALLHAVRESLAIPGRAWPKRAIRLVADSGILTVRFMGEDGAGAWTWTTDAPGESVGIAILDPSLLRDCLATLTGRTVELRSIRVEKRGERRDAIRLRSDAITLSLPAWSGEPEHVRWVDEGVQFGNPIPLPPDLAACWRAVRHAVAQDDTREALGCLHVVVGPGGSRFETCDSFTAAVARSPQTGEDLDLLIHRAVANRLPAGVDLTLRRAPSGDLQISWPAGSVRWMEVSSPFPDLGRVLGHGTRDVVEVSTDRAALVAAVRAATALRGREHRQAQQLHMVARDGEIALTSRGSMDATFLARVPFSFEGEPSSGTTPDALADPQYILLALQSRKAERVILALRPGSSKNQTGSPYLIRFAGDDTVLCAVMGMATQGSLLTDEEAALLRG